jgi:DNA polymerase-3 subunit delta
MTSTPEAVLKALTAKQYAPLYVVHGDEPYYIDLIAESMESLVVPSSEQPFNQFVLYGKDLSVAALLGHARRFPMLAERQLVLIKEAQDVAGLDAKDSSRLLEEYALHPVRSTVLVLCFKQPVDERKSWMKAVEKNGIVVASRKLYDTKVPDWIADYCHQRGAKVSKNALMMLGESVGNDLKRLANELDKILLNLRAGQDITAEVVETYVGVSKEYNNFEFQKALFQRDVVKANRIARFFAGNPKNYPIQPTLMVLYNAFSKLMLVHASDERGERALAAQLGVNPYFVKDYLAGSQQFPVEKTVRVLGFVRFADAQAKGVEAGSSDEGSILNELVFKILH